MREWSEFYNAVCSGRLSRLALIWLSSARLDAPAPELGSAQQAARAGSRQLGSGWLRLLELPQHYLSQTAALHVYKLAYYGELDLKPDLVFNPRLLLPPCWIPLFRF